jgi:hypothetical protein
MAALAHIVAWTVSTEVGMILTKYGATNFWYEMQYGCILKDVQH